MSQYKITIDKQPFLEYFNTRDGYGVTYDVPESGIFCNEVEEDLTIMKIFLNEDDVTAQFLTDFSNWYGAQGTGG